MEVDRFSLHRLKKSLPRIRAAHRLFTNSHLGRVALREAILERVAEQQASGAAAVGLALESDLGSLSRSLLAPVADEGEAALLEAAYASAVQRLVEELATREEEVQRLVSMLQASAIASWSALGVGAGDC